MWEHKAKHKCGYVHDVAFGNTDFLTKFGTICQGCGQTMSSNELETYISRIVYKGELLKPWTWLNFVEEKK